MPVFPFDWDGDGLENSVDPEPLVRRPDAHGTNAEWYNVVCSNVFMAVDVEGVVELRPRYEDVNTNAYYFVNICTEHGPAPLYLNADRQSSLGSPVVIALAGETKVEPSTQVLGMPAEQFSGLDWDIVEACSLGESEAGVAGRIWVRVLPNYVSFQHIRLLEGFAPAESIWGCCTNQTLFPREQICHGEEADRPGAIELHDWMTVRQEMTIEVDGTCKIRKNGIVLSRSIGGNMIWAQE